MRCTEVATSVDPKVCKDIKACWDETDVEVVVQDTSLTSPPHLQIGLPSEVSSQFTMDQIRFGVLVVVLHCSLTRSVLSVQKREWIDAPTARLTEGDIACFSEYMEMWIQSGRIEGLRVWLSGALGIPVNLASLDHLNLQLSACGFSLHKDADKNFIFRVSYTGCFVQQQHGFNVLTLTMVERINRFGGRPHSLMMKCPVVSVLQSTEQIHCDPEYIQVIRPLPYGNLDSELQWSLCLSDRLIVALEDASLIQMNVDMTGADITVQGKRREILSPVKIMEDEGEFLALKLVRGQYAYSMEATCPKVTTSTANKTVLYIFKRRMGLTKRGGYSNEAPTVSDVWVNQTNNFTVHETSEFVTLTIPTAQILQTQPCADNKQLLQPFYRVDVVLTFKETNHKMRWTMENTLPCIAGPVDALSHIPSSSGPNVTGMSTLGLRHESVTEELALSTAPRLNEKDPQLQGSSFHFHLDEMSKSQSGNVSSGFGNDTSTSTDAIETSFVDFPHATTNTSTQSPDFHELKATAEASEVSLTTLVVPEQEHQEFNTTSRNKDEQQQRSLGWIWED